jgi:hypothetical protein
MSRGNVEVIREPIATRGVSRRRLDERLGVRFPRALVAFSKMFFGLPTHSRVRRALVRRAVSVRIDADEPR